MFPICAVTFRLVPSPIGGVDVEKAISSLSVMKEKTGANTAVIAFIAYQDTPQSTVIDRGAVTMPTDAQLTQIIDAAHALGLGVVLKPMVNCKNGIWRAYIDFFDRDVPGEATWTEWFDSYGEYMLHYAAVAQKTGCEMLLAGCELVMSERQERHWRALIKKLRAVYGGLISYNTDKYQEDVIGWWDEVDVMSSSGYYPSGRWEENLERISRAAEKFGKPFFFAECGCPCRKGSENCPNNWEFQGEFDLETQRKWYEEMFTKCENHKIVEGFACWDWLSDLDLELKQPDGYGICGKPACETVRLNYQKLLDK